MLAEKLLNLDNGEKLLNYIDNKQWDQILHFLLSNMYHHPDYYLEAVDKGGATILTRLQNIKEGLYDEIEYSFSDIKIKQPPFWNALEKVADSERPILDTVQFFLKLGIDVNRQNPNYHNFSSLHFFLSCYLKKSYSVNTTALEKLIKAGGNIYLEEEHGLKPIDLVRDPLLKNFMIALHKNNNKTQEEESTITIQRAIRMYLYKKNSPALFSPKHTIESIKNSFPEFDHPDLTLEVKQQTKPNTIDLKIAEQWIEDHDESLRLKAKEIIDGIYYVSYELFSKEALPFAVEKFNEYIMSLPEEKRNYMVYLFSERYKSNPWVTRHAFDFCAQIPTGYIHSNNIGKTSVPTNVDHLLICEDHALSGNSILCFFDRLGDLRNKNHSLLSLEIHFVVPFITKKALERLKEYPIKIYYFKIIQEPDFTGTPYANAASLMYTQWKIPDTHFSTASCFREEPIKLDGKPSKFRFVPETTPVYKEGSNRCENEDAAVDLTIEVEAYSRGR